MPKFKVDFTETESRGGKKSMGARRHYPPGDYAVKCVRAELTTSSEKDTPGVRVTFRILSGEHKGGEVTDTAWLTPKSLWRLRNMLEAMGIKIPSKAVNVDTGIMQGKSLAITLDDEEYDNKVYSRVVDTFLLSELEEVESDEDTDDLGTDEDEEEGEESEKEDDDLEEIDLDDL